MTLFTSDRKHVAKPLAANVGNTVAAPGYGEASCGYGRVFCGTVDAGLYDDKGDTAKMPIIPSAANEGSGRSSSKASCHLKAAKRYLFAAIGCAAFAIIYAQFSHGVYSPFMTFMFAIPLIGGALLALVFHLAHAPALPRASRQAWALAISSLAVASCLRGVFEIAGTASPYLVVYIVAAVACAAIAGAHALRRKS